MYKPSSAVAGPAPLPTAAGAHLQTWLCWQEAQLPSSLSGCTRLPQRRLLGTDYTFPDGLGSKGCWLSALGLPSARLEPLQLDPAVLGELGSAHPARMDHRALPHIKGWPGPAQQQEPFVPAPGGSTGLSSLGSHRDNPAQPRTGHRTLPLGSTPPRAPPRMSLFLAQGR